MQRYKVLKVFKQGIRRSFICSVLILGSLTGCSLLTAAKVATDLVAPPSSGMEVNAQVGKTNTLNKGLIQSDTGDKIDADTIGTLDKSHIVKYDNVDTVVSQNIPWWVFLICCFGWAFIFITPKQLYIRWKNRND
jgi:hypothetical protein